MTKQEAEAKARDLAAELESLLEKITEAHPKVVSALSDIVDDAIYNIVIAGWQPADGYDPMPGVDSLSGADALSGVSLMLEPHLSPMRPARTQDEIRDWREHPKRQKEIKRLRWEAWEQRTRGILIRHFRLTGVSVAALKGYHDDDLSPMVAAKGLAHRYNLGQIIGERVTK